MAKLTKRQEQTLVKEYLEDEATPIDQLVAKYGIARQTLYSILRRHGVRPERRGEVGGLVPDELLDRMAAQSLRLILEELIDARNRVGLLEVALRRKGVDPDTL